MTTIRSAGKTESMTPFCPALAASGRSPASSGFQIAGRRRLIRKRFRISMIGSTIYSARAERLIWGVVRDGDGRVVAAAATHQWW